LERPTAQLLEEYKQQGLPEPTYLTQNGKEFR